MQKCVRQTHDTAPAGDQDAGIWIGGVDGDTRGGKWGGLDTPSARQRHESGGGSVPMGASRTAGLIAGRPAGSTPARSTSDLCGLSVSPQDAPVDPGRVAGPGLSGPCVTDDAPQAGRQADQHTTTEALLAEACALLARLSARLDGGQTNA